MTGRLSPGLAMVALLFLTVTQAPSAYAEDEPDLVLEVASLPDQANPRRVVFKVTNQSPFWADATSARVATVFTGPKGFIVMIPPPSNISEDIFIENLDPGQTTTFEYMLSSDCDGHELDVEVRPAKSWDGTPELQPNQANNKLDNFQLCKSTQSVSSDTATNPEMDDHVDYGACGYCGPEAAPAAKEPVWINVPMSHHRTFVRTTEGPQILSQGAYDGVSRVGFWQYDGSIDRGAVVSLGMHFEKQTLQAVTPNNFIEARIAYREEEAQPTSNPGDRGWKSGSGAFQAKEGCVSRIYITTFASIQGQNDFSANQMQTPVTPRDRTIDISTTFKSELVSPNSPANGFNYVLRGPLDSVDADDQTSCLSDISDVKLQVRYRPN